jgi:hypothetical protein
VIEGETRSTRVTSQDTKSGEGTRIPDSTSFRVVEKGSRGRISLQIIELRELLTRWYGIGSRGFNWFFKTVTVIGWTLLAFIILWWPLGDLLHWPEFAFLGTVAFLVMLLAAPFLLGGKNYAVEFELPENRVVAGTPVVANLAITNNGKYIELPGGMDIPIGVEVLELPIPLMRPGQTYNSPVDIPALRRGVITIGPITTVRSDPVGALRRELEWLDSQELFVHPATVSIPSTKVGHIRDLDGNPSSQIIDSDISFHAVREYVPGDSQKHIHWKSVAKTGKLMVRQYEESRRSRLALILGMKDTEYADPDEYELAVSAIGSLGLRAIYDGRTISIVASDEIPKAARGSVKSMREFKVQSRSRLLDDLCLVNMSMESMPLADVCALASHKFNDISLAIIVCGSTVSSRDLQFVRSKLPDNIGVMAIQVDPNAEPSFKSLKGMSVLTIAVLEDLAGLLGRSER